MNIYYLLNLSERDIESLIIESIAETKKNLQGLTTERTCKIYSDEVRACLRKRHLASQKVDTEYLGYPYSHVFNLVKIDDSEDFLIDLTFKQFNSNEFNLLSTKGYIKVDTLSLLEYLEIVGNPFEKDNKSKELK